MGTSPRSSVRLRGHGGREAGIEGFRPLVQAAMLPSLVGVLAVTDPEMRGSVREVAMLPVGSAKRGRCHRSNLEMMMRPFDLLCEITRCPEPFSVGGPQELWSDPHVQRQMLAHHLDPDVDAASREHGFIERSLAWIIEARQVGPQTRVLDLGCGPGLYANPLASQGARVHGIDLSAVAIEEARRRGSGDGATYEVGDYLEVSLPEHDVALLIYCDYCAMSPADRRRLLRRVRARMSDGGRLLVDLHSEQRYATLEEGCVVAERLMDGFWAAGEYFGIHQTVLYDDVRVALDRYVVVEPERTRLVHAWLAHLTVEEARSEFEAAGFAVCEVLGDVAGAPFDPAGTEFALVAMPN